MVFFPECRFSECNFLERQFPEWLVPSSASSPNDPIFRMIHFLEKLRSSFVCCSIKRVYYTQFLNRQSNKEGYTIDAITLKCVKLRQLCVPKTFRTNKLFGETRYSGDWQSGNCRTGIREITFVEKPIKIGQFLPEKWCSSKMCKNVFSSDELFFTKTLFLV